MNRTQGKRIGRVQDAVDAAPVCRHTLREDYDCFRMFGELPEDDRLAFEVITQALHSGKEQRESIPVPFGQRKRPAEYCPPSVRTMLFDEAISDAMTRDVARAVIATEVAHGGDVGNPAFADRHGLPGYGSVALHVGGWPGMLAKPPYEEQAERLFVRMDNVRGRIPHDAPGWYDAFGTAMSTFFGKGILPPPGLTRDTVLVFVELGLLVAHYVEADVGDLMRLVDDIAHSNGDEQDELLAKLETAAREGLLP